MEYVKIEGQFPKFSHCAVTLGKFDGIHRGHRKLIQTILNRKKEYGELAVVMAFVSDRQTILTSEERRILLEKMGVDYLQADTGAKAEVGPMPAAEQQAAVQTEVVEMPEGRIAFEVTELDDAFNVGGNFTQRTGAEKSLSALSSPQRSSTQPQPEKSAERIRAEGGRPSVKRELGELKREQAQKKAAERRPPQRRRPPKNRKKQKGR